MKHLPPFRCTGQWAGDRCNDIPIWGKAVLGAFGLFLVILVIVLVVKNHRKRRQVKEDKTELVENVSHSNIDSNTSDGNRLVAFSKWFRNNFAFACLMNYVKLVLIPHPLATTMQLILGEKMYKMRNVSIRFNEMLSCDLWTI